MVAPQIPTLYSAAGKSLVIDPTLGQQTYTQLGQLLANYNRSQTILFNDDFDTYSQSIYASAYDIATLHVGVAGTNNISGNISMVTLTTDAHVNDTEGTRSVQAFLIRSKLPRLMCKVNLVSNADVIFRLGFYNAAAKYAWIEFDSSLDTHWRFTLNDNTGAEYSTTVGDIVGAGTDYYLELWSASDGTMHWGEIASNPIIPEIVTAGITKKLTGDSYYFQFLESSLAVAAKVAKVDMIEYEKLKTS